MTEHPNAALVRRGYAALAARDVEALAGMTHDDLVWHIPGRNPIAGEYHGRDRVLAFNAHVLALTGGTLTLELVDVWANEHGAVALHRGGGTRPDGRPNHDEVCMVFTIRDGRIAEARYYPFDQYGVDAFWA